MSEPRWIRRYDDGTRMRHWTVAVGFVLAALSGLSMFHPALFWLSALFGGGPWMRILHPFLGLFMFLAFLLLMVRVWSHNFMQSRDWQWMKQWKDVVENREENLPEVGRYNAGQKILFWLLVVCLFVLFVTGILFWRPYFAQYVPITVVRFATLLHSASAAVLIIAIIVHVYAGIWVKGSIGAMTRGFVSARWARKHHAAWYREVTKSEP
jgi:formate dehydrogenase subunit gamma